MVIDQWSKPLASSMHVQAHHPGPNRWIPDGELGRRVRFLDRIFDLRVMDRATIAVIDAIRPEAQRDPTGVALARAQLHVAYDWLEATLGEGAAAVGDQFTR